MKRIVNFAQLEALGVCLRTSSNLRHYGIIVFAGLLLNAALISIPGYFSHDELTWINAINRGSGGWGFGLGNPLHSPFFRLLGTIVISASLRLPLEPFGAHFIESLIAIATACILYQIVRAFRPERALAAAILFMVMPGFAFDVGWVAAGFDVQFTFWGALSVLWGIQYWRRGNVAYLTGSIVAYAIALGCKETALSIPICALLVMWSDRTNLNKRHTAYLISSVFIVTMIYFGIRWNSLFHMSTAGSGGYAFGGKGRILHNAVPYFGFPFAYHLQEITNFPSGHYLQMLLLCFPHLLLVGAIFFRYGWKWSAVYLVAFYATLLPVLPISKFETQYEYAASIPLAVSLALLWSRQWLSMVAVSVLTIVLVAHSLVIQNAMYETGACQARALTSLQASLRSLKTPANPSILIQNDQPWWVLVRAVVQNQFSTDGQSFVASATHDPAIANMEFDSSCVIHLKN